MQKLDRLGWTAGFAFTAYGARVGVRTNDTAALDRLPELLPPQWEEAESPIVDALFSLRVGRPRDETLGRREYTLLYDGSARLMRTLDPEEVFPVLENAMTLAVAYFAQPDRLFVHAGVVGWQGKAIVIPGRSHSGKTSLVAELVRAGADYYSDEMAILDGDGRVHPYPRLIALREPEGRRQVSPEELGGRAGQAPLPVGLIVVAQHEPGAAWRPRALTPARALMALLNNTVAARKDPASYLPILRKAVTESEAIKGKRGEAADIAHALLERVAAGNNRRLREAAAL